MKHSLLLKSTEQNLIDKTNQITSNFQSNPFLQSIHLYYEVLWVKQICYALLNP